MARQNSKLYLRGRFVREPVHGDQKDGSGKKFLVGRLAVDSPYETAQGDLRTATDYFEVQVFASSIVADLVKGGVCKGALVALEGRAKFVVSEYEDKETGEKRTNHSMAIVIDHEDHHSGIVESLPSRND